MHHIIELFCFTKNETVKYTIDYDIINCIGYRGVLQFYFTFNL